MKIEKLTVGETYKNWKALCEVLEVKAKPSGNSRDAQARDFKQYFDWTKQGQKITITEIYDTVQEREDGRKDNTFTKRHEQESVFSKNELQLAILWTLGKKAYEMPKTHGELNGFCIPAKELYVAVGLCNEFYNMLTKDKYYYTKRYKEEDGLYWKWQVDLAFKGVHNDMKERMITSFNQLQRKKVLEFSYWKAIVNSNGLIPFTDEQMNIFVSVREDVLDWWNNNHSKTYSTIGKFYEYGSPKEVKEFEDKLKEKLIETEKFGRSDDFKYYTSCFKIHYDLRSVTRELTERGYKVDSYEDFKESFKNSMKYVVKRINKKFIERHEDCLIKQREKHFNTFEKFIEELDREVECEMIEPKRGFGRVRTTHEIQTVKEPFHALTDDTMYNDTKGLMMLGLKQKEELNEFELATVQAIDCQVKKNKN